MNTVLNKYSNFILLIPVLFIVAWLFPSAGMTLLIISLSLGIFINCMVILKKHREPYLQGKISRTMFIRNVFLETIGILLVIGLAGFLGDTLGKIATRQIYDDLTKFITGILVGLLVGVAVGIFSQRIRKNYSGLF